MKLPTPHTLLLFILILAGASCTRYKDIVYLQDKSDNKVDSSGFYPYQVPTYKIQNRDILYIRIISMNKEVTEVMNMSSGNAANTQTNEAGIYLSGYNVNDSGFVEIPILGKVKVAGKTLERAKDAIISQTLNYLKDPTVIVKLVSFKYSVFGEVNRPGTYTNFNNQLTVLEAISQAGNIGPFGDMRRVMVIRSNISGTSTFRLDLTDRKILQSEGYFLLPNDVVYIEPVRSYNFRNNIPTISITLGAISTVFLILNYFK